MSYSINFWGSHPDDDNDDCWMGEDYATLAEAIKAFNMEPVDLVLGWVKERLDKAPDTISRGLIIESVVSDVRSSAYIEINGPDIHEVNVQGFGRFLTRNLSRAQHEQGENAEETAPTP